MEIESLRISHPGTSFILVALVAFACGVGADRLLFAHASAIEAPEEGAAAGLTTPDPRDDVLFRETVARPSHQSFLNYGKALYDSGNFPDSYLAAYAAIGFNKESPSAWSNLCATLNMMGKPGEAEAACVAALKIDANFEVARSNLGWARSLKAEQSK